MTTRPVEELLSRLDGVRRVGSGWMAFCPAHPNTNTPALSIGVGRQGQAIVKCHSAGCTADDIAAAVGLRITDLFDGERPSDWVPPPPPPMRVRVPGAEKKEPRPLGRLVTAYDYVDLDGVLRYQVCRFEPKDFRQRQPCSHPSTCGYTTANGKPCRGWHWNLKGVELILYRLRQVVRAVERGDFVFLCEGEKDAENLYMAGGGQLATTTAPLGASEGKGKWMPQFTHALIGADVVYLPDNDPAGEAQSVRITNELVGLSRSVRVLHLPDLPPKGDVTNWLLELGGTPEALLALVAKINPIPRAKRWRLAAGWRPSPTDPPSPL